MNYWINTVSREHVMVGKKAGIVQANHGKLAPLKRLSIGDRVIFYSPKTSLVNGEPLKSFTAVAEITENNIYQVELSKDFTPYRINAKYEECNEVNILLLIESLIFIKNKKSWGYMFMFGLFRISKDDFDFIYSKMKK